LVYYYYDLFTRQTNFKVHIKPCAIVGHVLLKVDLGKWTMEENRRLPLAFVRLFHRNSLSEMVIFLDEDDKLRCGIDPDIHIR